MIKVFAILDARNADLVIPLWKSVLLFSLFLLLLLSVPLCVQFLFSSRFCGKFLVKIFKTVLLLLDMMIVFSKHFLFPDYWATSVLKKGKTKTVTTPCFIVFFSSLFTVCFWYWTGLVHRW